MYIRTQLICIYFVSVFVDAYKQRWSIKHAHSQMLVQATTRNKDTAI